MPLMFEAHVKSTTMSHQDRSSSSPLSAKEQDSAALASLFLARSCSKIPKVGPKLLERLAGLHIYNIHDLLWHLPRSFEDRRTLIPLSRLHGFIGKTCQTELEILSVKMTPGKTSRLIIECQDAHEESMHQITLIFFKPQRHQKLQWEKHNRVRIFGEVSQYTQHGLPRLQMIHPEALFLDNGDIPLSDHLTPIYPSTQGIYQKQWRQWTQWIFDQLDKAPFSIDFIQQTGLVNSDLNLLEALKQIHQGDHIKIKDTGEQLINREHPAYQYLILTEIITHQLLWTPRIQQTESPAFQSNKEAEEKVLAALPFKMTGAQQRSLQEIYTDLAQPASMLRLLQGDVGSGKTLVAALAAAQVATQKNQVAILAPTEILAGQHLEAFRQFLAPLDLNIQLLTGRLKAKERRRIMELISTGECDIVIGTHALFQKDIIYKNLSFIIIDEQHRFGVAQRLSLLEKGLVQHPDGHTTVPHQLMMTATPIPRTLTMSIYAHMQTSVIDELPPSRKVVTTKAIGEDQREHLYERVKAFIKTGQQVFWVCTLIQETENSGEKKSIEETYESLQAHLPGINIGLLHGQLDEDEKKIRLDEFIRNQTQILLATSMVEVGVNIPNANLMIVEDAHNWGLTQLHQLRGRVGRGDKEGFMILIHKIPLQQTSFERLNILRETTDGFVIADKDLAIRGPGHIIGTAQSGHPDFRVVDLNEDQDLFPEAKKIGQDIHNHRPFLASLIIKSHHATAQQLHDQGHLINRA